MLEFGELGLSLHCHHSQVPSGSEMHLVGRMYGLDRTKLCTYSKVNCLKNNCF